MNTKLRVLLVEDDEAIQKLTCIHLEPYATVVVAGSIRAAQKEHEANPDFCLIILDGRVPRFDNGILTPDDTTLALAWYIINKWRIPAYSFSSDDELNDKLAKMGCIHTNKFTAVGEAKKALIALKT